MRVSVRVYVCVCGFEYVCAKGRECVFVYEYVFVCMSMYVCKCVCGLWKCVCACLCLWVFVFVWICVCVWVYASMCVSVRECVWVCVGLLCAWAVCVCVQTGGSSQMVGRFVVAGELCVSPLTLMLETDQTSLSSAHTDEGQTGTENTCTCRGARERDGPSENRGFQRTPWISAASTHTEDMQVQTHTGTQNYYTYIYLYIPHTWRLNDSPSCEFNSLFLNDSQWRTN